MRRTGGTGAAEGEEEDKDEQEEEEESLDDFLSEELVLLLPGEEKTLGEGDLQQLRQSMPSLKKRFSRARHV